MQSKPSIYLAPYKLYSKSAKYLQADLHNLGYKCWRTQKEIDNPDSLVINWGNKLYHHADLNSKAMFAIDKIVTYMLLNLHEIPTLEWTIYYEEANEWFKDGHLIVCRHSINGSKGIGIELVSNLGSDINPTETLVINPHFKDTLPDVPLYTKYKKKSKEFRVYVFKDTIISILEKRKRKGFLNVNTYIRSHNYGWVFCKENINTPEGIQQLAINAVKALDLDFGGVDIIWNKKENKCYVLEINTAPGISNSNSKAFAETIHKYIEE